MPSCRNCSSSKPFSRPFASLESAEAHPETWAEPAPGRRKRCAPVEAERDGRYRGTSGRRDFLGASHRNKKFNNGGAAVADRDFHWKTRLIAAARPEELHYSMHQIFACINEDDVAVPSAPIGDFGNSHRFVAHLSVVNKLANDGRTAE